MWSDGTLDSDPESGVCVTGVDHCDGAHVERLDKNTAAGTDSVRFLIRFFVQCSFCRELMRALQAFSLVYVDVDNLDVVWAVGRLLFGSADWRPLELVTDGDLM